MTKLLILSVLTAWGTLLISNPYLIAIIFAQVLILLTIVLGSVRRFIGFILFIVYVGGIIILIRYCVILIPWNKFHFDPILLILFYIFAPTFPFVQVFSGNSYTYGLLQRRRAVLLLSLLLYLVMYAVVVIIDYRKGMIKT